MKIYLTPVRTDAEVIVSHAGDTLTVNGEAYDFSQLGEGDTLHSRAVDCEWIVGEITRVDGEIHATVIEPHGPQGDSNEH